MSPDPFPFFMLNRDSSLSGSELQQGLARLNLTLDEQELALLMQVTPHTHPTGLALNLKKKRPDKER